MTSELRALVSVPMASAFFQNDDFAPAHRQTPGHRQADNAGTDNDAVDLFHPTLDSHHVQSPSAEIGQRAASGKRGRHRKWPADDEENAEQHKPASSNSLIRASGIRFLRSSCCGLTNSMRSTKPALTILEEIGLDFLHEDALKILAGAGADVKAGAQRVRFDRALIKDLVGKARAEFTLHARNPAHDIAIGGREMVFAMMASAPNCSDMHTKRHPGTKPDFERFVRMAQALNCIHLIGGYPVEPVDLPAPTRPS